MMNFLDRRIWPWLAQNVILPVGDRVFGQRMMQHLRFLRESQWWNRDRLEAYRNVQLSTLIQMVYREVPFYRNLMDDSGVAPDQIRTSADLARIPVVTKAMLRARYPDQTTRDTGQRTYESCSSGSTGAPFCVREDAYTAGWYRAAFLLALEWAGWPIGAPHVQTGMTLTRPQGRRLKDLLLRCHYVSAYDLTDAHLDRVLDHIDRQRIEYVWGYPGSLYYLAQRALQKGWNHRLSAAATWGDNLYAHYRATIEHAFQTRVYDHYGCGEGIMIAAQCGQGNHYHLFQTDVIVEYLDDQDQPVPSGQIGNLVVTRLHAGPMPLIRYRVGDIGISGSDRVCACGRHLEIMESIQGRDTDVILTPSGNRLIVHFFTGILEFFNEIDTFQVLQEMPDSVVLRIVPRGLFTKDTERRVVAALKEKGADLAINVEVMPEIAVPPNGKRRFVISKLATAAQPPPKQD